VYFLTFKFSYDYNRYTFHIRYVYMCRRTELGVLVQAFGNDQVGIEFDPFLVSFVV
jgi:hypothetical protein